ncbi:MAG: response regulator transcription factor [Oscillospiraceae bacterium]|nr:response regulator transcription factor [Oscillospiraceae bacterium]
MLGKKLLLVEDDEKILAFNKALFEGRGFSVGAVTTIAQAKEALEHEEPDLIILDVNLPDGSGLDFLQELRKVSKVPVLILTGYDKDKNIIAGFESGCNDYLAKPYTFDVLLVRAKNLLQDAVRVADTISVGELRLDLISNRAYINDEDLNLTEKEFGLIRFFAQNEGNIISADDIYEKLWRQPMVGDKNALQVAIARLRKKLEPSGYDIVSIRGKGYVLTKA